MEKRRNARTLKQVRAFNTKEKIIDTAYKLFCEKGYYKTTSIQISKTAGISIGCFYSYFKDKDAVFFEIIDLYNKDFLKIVNDLSAVPDIYIENKNEWLLFIIKKLIDLHKKSKDFNKELSSLYNSNSAVSSLLDNQHNKIKQFIKNFLIEHQDDIQVTDIAAASIVTYDIVNSTVNTVISESEEISSDRMIQAGIEAITSYLFK